MVHEYNPVGVCSMKIIIETDDEKNIIKSVKFIGGCHGNTQGVAALLVGMDIDEAISRLKGIDCGGSSSHSRRNWICNSCSHLHYRRYFSII